MKDIKEFYRELKKIFDEYGSICLGIAGLYMTGMIMAFFITCGIVAFIMWMFGLSFNCTVGVIVWLIMILTIKIIKNHIEEKENNDKNET